MQRCSFLYKSVSLGVKPYRTYYWMCTYQDAASYVLLNDVSKDSDGKSEKMAGDKY